MSSSSASPAVISDAEAISSLLSDQPLGEALRLADRQLRYMTPTSSVYTQSINFDMVGINRQIADFSEAFLEIPLTITSAVALTASPDFPPVAFKDSILNALWKTVVRSADGSLNVSHDAYQLNYGSHLRLALQNDEDWLQSVGPSLHFQPDRGHKNIPSLYDVATISVPVISPYRAAPVAGAANDSGYGLNPAYNDGFVKRNTELIKAAMSNTGALPAITNEIKFVARIPLKYISDFFNALVSSGPMFNLRLQMEFYLANTTNTQFCPIAVGGVVAGTQSTGGAMNISVTNGGEPRLYYHEIKLRPEHATLYAQRLASGFQKRVLFRSYQVLKDNAAQKNMGNTAIVNHLVSSAAVMPQRLWILAYPTNAIGNNTTWPGLLTTGPCGVTNLNVSINSQNLFSSALNTLEEQYDQLLDAAHLGEDSADREMMFSKNDFRLTHRLTTVDLSRSGSIQQDPNSPSMIVVTGTVASPVPVDIIYVLEQLQEFVLDFSNGTARATVSQASFK